MRRTLLMLIVLLTAWTMVPVVKAVAQSSGDDQDQSDQDKKKKKEEWELKQAPLPGRKNAGPCPYVKVLYDAARFVEFKDNQEASGAVAYTGEIQGITSDCEYKASEPIKVKMDVQFNFGRGPQGSGSHKTYTYWVAVTHRNREILAKQEFTVPVAFSSDRMGYVDHIKDITIPRANNTVSGENFEILVGFDVTPEMADFNRQGKRFRINAGAPVVAEADSKGK
jgi:hypothetical protein